MPLEGEYEPSTWDWVAEQAEAYERSDGAEANTFADTGLPIILITTRGAKSGKLRKSPLMRVEHDGRYVLVGSQGGLPTHPGWCHNLWADPTALVIQDGADRFDAVARQVEGDERAEWWARAVAAYGDYEAYQAATEREIPVFVAERA